jgi:ketosteroid isomerase-like protein
MTADPALEALRAYESAVFNKNVEAIAVLSDDDVRVFDMWGRWHLQGISEWLSMAADRFASLDTERAVVGIAEVQTHFTGELAVGHAFLKFTAISVDGAEL